MKDLNLVDDVTVTVHAHDVRLLPQTNADRIRAMSDEELAWWLSDVHYIQRDPLEWEMWLKSPVEEGEDNGKKDRTD